MIVSENITPSKDLENHYDNISRLYELLAKSEDDVRNGRTAPIDGMFERIRFKVRNSDING